MQIKSSRIFKSKISTLSFFLSQMSNLFLVFIIILLSSCSLKYNETLNVSKTVPELSFENTTMTRYENNKTTLSLKAEVLEQYQDSSETYAKNVSFASYEDEAISTNGSCGYILVNTDKEIYELYDEIELFNHKENIKFYANVLKWNAKTEQLTSGRGDVVKIEKDDTVIRGSGFSASGVSKTFSFRGNITGEIETEEESESPNDDNFDTNEE